MKESQKAAAICDDKTSRRGNEQVAGMSHLRRAKEQLGEWTNDPGVGRENVHPDTHTSEKRSKVLHTTDLPDAQKFFDSPTDQHRRDHPLVHGLTQQANYQIPSSLLYGIFQNQDHFKDVPYLDVSTSIFAPGHLYRAPLDSIENQIKLAAKANSALLPNSGTGHSSDQIPRLKSSAAQHILPTPPDSTSSLWSPELPSVPNDGANFLEEPHGAGYSEVFTQQYGLSIRTTTESLEDLSEQIRCLSLQQQQIAYDVMTSSNNTHAPGPRPEQGTPSHLFHPRSFNMPHPALSRPSMPISLQDLVARHTSIHDAPENNAIIQAPPTARPNSDPAEHHRETISSPDNENFSVAPLPKDEKQFRTGLRDVLTGRRHLRSIPLSRLVEKKLATVPEETSIASVTSETLPTTTSCTSGMAASDAAVPVKDYDFSELRSPFTDTILAESLGSQAEPPVLSTGRKAEGNMPQEKRDVQLGLPAKRVNAGKKPAPKASGRKPIPNDENVHNPSTSTPRKRSTAHYKGIRAAQLSKRGKARRKN